MSQTLHHKRALMTDHARPMRKRFIHDQIERIELSKPDTVFNKVCRYVIAVAWVAAVVALIVGVQS